MSQLPGILRRGFIHGLRLHTSDILVIAVVLWVCGAWQFTPGRLIVVIATWGCVALLGQTLQETIFWRPPVTDPEHAAWFRADYELVPRMMIVCLIILIPIYHIFL